MGAGAQKPVGRRQSPQALVQQAPLHSRPNFCRESAKLGLKRSQQIAYEQIGPSGTAKRRIHNRQDAKAP